MKNLITTIASLMLFSLCLLQFISSEVTYIKMVNAEEIISEYEAKAGKDGIDKEGLKSTLSRFLARKGETSSKDDDIRVLENDHDGYKEYEISYVIHDTIGPAKTLKIPGELCDRRVVRKAIVKKAKEKEPELPKPPVESGEDEELKEGETTEGDNSEEGSEDTDIPQEKIEDDENNVIS